MSYKSMVCLAWKLMEVVLAWPNMTSPQKGRDNTSVVACFDGYIAQDRLFAFRPERLMTLGNLAFCVCMCSRTNGELHGV